MNSRITPDHLGRAAVVYVRQSTLSQVTGNLESQRRQYDLDVAESSTYFIYQDLLTVKFYYRCRTFL